MRIATLGCTCALALLAFGGADAFDPVARETLAGMGGGPLGCGASGGGAAVVVAQMKPNSVPLPAAEADPAARSAESTECAQQADAQGLEGKTRKHFLRDCKPGI
jgi:hypothetical protein